MAELGSHGKDQDLKGVTGARLGSHESPMGRTRTSRGSLGQDPCGSLLSHPVSHKQDSCGSLGHHWGGLEQGRVLQTFQGPASSLLLGVLLGQMLGKWGPAAMPPQLPQPNAGTGMCPWWCSQTGWGGNTHRVFVPPGPSSAGAATLSSRHACAGLRARER